ncbi:MAG: site-specific recombinase XerD [Verrucomicrobiales bacterium]|jgi:site-specific recombinase XerD
MLCVAAHTGARRADIALMGMDDLGEANDGTVTVHVIGKRNKERTLYRHGGVGIATVAGVLGHANVQTKTRYDRRGE